MDLLIIAYNYRLHDEQAEESLQGRGKIVLSQSFW